MAEDINTNEVLALTLGTLLIIYASVVIPVYGYYRRRLKGLALGCLLQPVACGIVIVLLFGGLGVMSNYRINKERKAAMVTVRSTEAGTYGTDTITWHLKPDEECLVDYKIHKKQEYDNEDSLYVDDETERFDIIRLDSLKNAVCVDDRLIVRFDLKNQKVTATDFDTPVEVVSVDWEKVKAFFP